MMRRHAMLLVSGLTFAACGQPAPSPAPAAPAAPFTVVETDIATIQAALRERRVTSRELTARYLERIATYEDRLNAIITVNPRALDEAEAMDRERAAGRVRGPLHGIPISTTVGDSCAGSSRSRTTSTPPTSAPPAAHWRSAT